MKCTYRLKAERISYNYRRWMLFATVVWFLICNAPECYRMEPQIWLVLRCFFLLLFRCANKIAYKHKNVSKYAEYEIKEKGKTNSIVYSILVLCLSNYCGNYRCRSHFIADSHLTLVYSMIVRLKKKNMYIFFYAII